MFPYEQNLRADLLSKLATSKVVGFNRTIIHETLASPSIEAGEVYSIELVPVSSWMSSILCYLQYGKLPPNGGETMNIIRKAA